MTATGRPTPGNSGKLSRLSFPEDEAKHSWLSLLLDAYSTADAGVAEGVRRQERQGRTLACRRGCSACCRTHRTIPVYPLELVGLSWYATEKLSGPIRNALKARLRAHQAGAACPFLVDDGCSVHPMRPLACRHFNVFDKVCEEGEDAYYSRRHDVLTPLKSYMDGALDTMLPFYGVTKKSERRQAIRTGTVHQLARVMGDMTWRSLADKMEARDKRASVEEPSRTQPPPKSAS